jgi:hypothetical protein
MPFRGAILYQKPNVFTKTGSGKAQEIVGREKDVCVSECRDPAQRPPALDGEYLASHTKDVLSGFFEERVERALRGHTGPLMRSGTMHIDAFRDTQVSY